MKKYFLLLALILSTYSFAQKTIKNVAPPKRDVILDSDVIPPTFPEGNEAFTKLLYSNFIVENIDCSQNGTQITMIEFVVERDGSIVEVVTSGSNASLNKEAIRIVQSIRQKWNPATLNGVNVRSRFHQIFRLVCE